MMRFARTVILALCAGVLAYAGLLAYQGEAKAQSVVTPSGAVMNGLAEDCGPDKGKCSDGYHCCLLGGSGWCCANGHACGADIGSCK
jgi:hypothetical protein